MRNILFLICIVGMPFGSRAETKQASWANLSALHAGQKIQVVEMNSKKHSGTFVNVSDKALSYKETTGEQTIQKEDVRSVKLKEHRHRLRNTLILGGVGAGVGAGIGAATWREACTAQSFCVSTIGIGGRAAIGAGLGLLGGAVVGALLPNHNTIYRVNSH